MEGLKAIVSLVFFCQFLHQYGVGGWRTAVSVEEDIELERQLKILNKQPITTFQVKGDLYDCIDIYKQPAFDHPLLKNHKVQMRPTYQPKPQNIQTSSTEKDIKAMIRRVHCPQGTVPILRTTKEDLIRAKNISQPHLTNIHPNTVEKAGQHIVALSPILAKTTTYYGVAGRLNVYSLKLKKDQQSTVQMWIENSTPDDKYASLQAGWMVSPSISGNSDSRLFVFWGSDSLRDGCFNMKCPGYVQVDRKLGPTSHFYPPSVIGGKQYYVDIAIFKDKTTGDWWLKVHGKDVGYWPKAIVPQLSNGASLVAWGGMATGPPDGVSPPMGNGHYPDGDFMKACFIKQLHTVDAANNFVVPDEDGMDSFVDRQDCYGFIYMGKKLDWGLTLLVGGPGGKCGW